MSEAESVNESAALKRALLAIRDLRTRLEAVERSRREPIAVVGLGCRFPGGAVDADSYWRQLRDGIDAVGTVPRDRWDSDALYDENPDAPGKSYSRHGGFLPSIDRFDALFFGISPREATSIDPQQRLLLEVAWEALENAGQDFGRLPGSDTGVFVGISSNEYMQLQLRNRGTTTVDAYSGTGNAYSVASGRLSYLLGLHGPTMSVDTACSSSLVAVQLACQALRDQTCGMALAGGVSLMLMPESTIVMSKVRALSMQGRCRTFDASADGYVRGEGCGVLVLKRLSDAQADGDRILAVIRGVAVNHDGRSSGLTVPNGLAQQAVIRAALEDAGVAPLDIDYIEAHGTGTALGDPIEVRALAAVLCEGRSADQPLLVGAVKANIGHLEAAAGISSLIKLILALDRGELPPQLHLQRLTPHVDWASLPIRVPTERTSWNPGTRRRLAGVNSFGLSGTNAHVIVEQAPPAETGTWDDRPCRLLTLSGKTPTAVQTMAGRFERYLATQDASLPDVCFTASTRAQFPYRVGIVARDVDEARSRLQAIASAETPSAAGIREWSGISRPKVAFLFTGQGSQYAGMGRMLYDTEPVFRTALDRCAAALPPAFGRDLLGVMFGRDADAGACLNQTGWTQPALFALEYALAELWRSWGVEPAAVLGHSVGEYAAACFAGVFEPEDGMGLLATRAGLMQALPPGGEMAAVFAAEAPLQHAIAGARTLSIAAVNGPESCVISGDGAEIRAILAAFEQKGVSSKPLNVSHAFHSGLMTPMLDEFEAAARRIQYRGPTVPIVSNITGRRADAFDASYWRRHVLAPVRFAAGVQELVDIGCSIFVEIGPAPVLIGMVPRSLGDAAVASVPSLRPGREEARQMLESAAELYVNGVALDWIGVEGGRTRRKVALPTYPFERERFWSDPVEDPIAAAAAMDDRTAVHPLLGSRWRSPGLDRVVFQAEMSPSRVPSVRDHVVQDMCVFPAAGYVEAMQAAVRLTTADPFELTAVTIEEPLILAEDQPRVVQTLVTPPSGQTAGSVEVYSAPAGADEAVWAAHVRATVSAGRAQPANVDLAVLRARCPAPIEASRVYEELGARGFEYGPTYRVVKELWGGDGEALGRLELSSSAASQASRMFVHPGLLDGALHVLGAALWNRLEKALFLPVGVGRIAHVAQASGPVWAHVRVRPGAGSTDTIVADVMLFGDGGEVLVTLGEFTAKRVDAGLLARIGGPALDEWFYRVEWHEASAGAPAGSAPARWVVFAQSENLVAPLVERLRASSPCTVITPGERYGPPEHGVARARFSDREDVARALRDAAPADASCGVLFMAAPAHDAASNGHSAPDADVTEGLLHVVQGLASADAGHGLRLWVVTRGAQAVAGSIGDSAVAQAPALGLARVAASEHPELGCVRVDVDPHGPPSDWDLLVEQLQMGDEEPEIAFRAGRRFVRRLMPARQTGVSRETLMIPSSNPFRIGVTARGVIDNIVVQPLPRREPGPGEIEVEVAASGLNFRDVLNVLGMYPGEPGPLGGEFAGRVVRIGTGVTGFAEGDEVMGIGGGSLASHVVVKADWVVKRPAWLTVSAAASLPIAYVTAWYGLHHLARIKRGDRVLIHAAAGGVGIAAVQIAKRAGAEVFGTAGSPEKRRFVHALGVDHVFSSRTADFTPALMQATGNRGVDIVLNALTGDFISKSLAALAPGGTFLEIGKAEIWSDERVKSVNPSARYLPYDLAEIGLRDPALIGSILRGLLDAFQDRSLRLMPLRTFEMRDARAAFRYMAQARHIGKLALARPVATGSDRIDREAAYLVTGGLGAIGLRVARLLVERGAGAVFLLGRSEPTPAAAEQIEEMRRLGGNVQVVRADASVREDLERALQQIDGYGLPLRGVFHAAGILDDAVLSEQTGARFRAVLAAKANGAALLHQATADRRLDQFVLFSSIASIFGAPSQGPYASANSVLDVLAARRRALGLPAQSINWGPWEEAGMAARLDADRRARVAQQGFRMIPTDRGLTALVRAMASDHAQLAIVPVDWGRVLGGYADNGQPPLLRDLAPLVRRAPRSGAAAAAPVRLADQLKDTPASEWREVVVNFVRQQIAKVMALPSPDSLREHMPLTDMGIDSLMAIELRNALGAAIGRTLPASLVYDRPTIDALADHLLGIVAPAAPEPAAVVSSVSVSIAAAAPAGQPIEGLSQEELAVLLADRLATLGKELS